jgi:hypothetical protein
MRLPTKRLAAISCALVCAAVAPAGALAAQSQRGYGTVWPPAGPASGRVSGTIVSSNWSSFTIQTGGRRMAVINALNAAADVVDNGDFSYVYGGGHMQAGLASVGIKGPGHNGRRIGYDCSGSVAAVLAGAGLWPAGSAVPNDAGLVTELLHEHLIAHGAGHGPGEVTLYDKPGVHIFMNIDGRFFGTSDGGAGEAGRPDGGAGWLDDGAPDAASRAFKQYHVLVPVLMGFTTYGQDLVFQTGRSATLIDGFNVGDTVRVTYTRAPGGGLEADDVVVLDRDLPGAQV